MKKYFLLLLGAVALPFFALGQSKVSDKLFASIQILKTTELHKQLEKQRGTMLGSVRQFKQHLEAHPPDSKDDSLLTVIKTAYEEVRTQYNFAIQRLKLDLSDPDQLQKFLRKPKGESEQYLNEVKQAHELYKFNVARNMDALTQANYASIPLWQTMLAAWAVYQQLQRFAAPILNLTGAWKTEYRTHAPELLEQYYFKFMYLPTWDDIAAH